MKDFLPKDWFFLILNIVTIAAGVASIAYGDFIYFLCAIALVVIIGYFTYVHFRHRGYPFSVITSRICADIVDKDGKLAHFWKEHIIRPNQPNRKDFNEFISQDGKAQNINASIVGVKSQLIHEDAAAGGVARKFRIQVRHLFDTELVKGQEYRRRFSYDLIDSYMNAKEKYHLVVDRPIKNVTIELKFPAGIEIRSIRVCRDCPKKGEIILDSQPMVQHGDRTIFLHEFIKPKFGHYFIEWYW
jgi:hypothetical protein